MSSSNTLPPIQIFPDSRQLDSIVNFLAFSDSIISIARGYGLEGYIDGSIPRPAANIAPDILAAGPTPGQPVIPTPTANNSPSPSINEWELRNARIAAIIYMNVKDPRGIGLNPNLVAVDMWNRILSK
ncbi:hypothetical protein F5878DRAFT_535201, partial [Lentinula raphanica]